MSVKEILSVIAGLLMIAGYVPYIRAMLKRETKPIKATWFIWGFLNTILFMSMYFANSLNNQIAGATIGTWIVAVLTLKYGLPGWTRIDKLCIAGAAISVALWQIFHNPIVGIMASLGALSIGSIPTFTSVWRDPNRENKLAWTINWFSCLCMFIAIPQWTLAKASQPTVYFILSSIIMGILYSRPLMQKR
jgi:hypothetical protein